MALKLHSILSQGWLYRGEGNANVVLWLPKTHQILRIKKIKKPSTILEWFFGWLMNIFKWDYTKEIQEELRNLDFYNLIMIPLLGEAYVGPATGIFVHKTEIQKLEKELMPFRPEHRKTKCLQYGTASLLRDCAFLSPQWDYYDFESATYALEIKPKQGWIPLVDRNLNKCQFCLNQYLKRKTTKIKKLSSYCPLDLFSGDPERMKRALNALINNPQNNFRIFKDGIYCYGEDAPMHKFYDLLQELYGTSEISITSLIDDFDDLILQALLKNFEEENYGCVNKCDVSFNENNEIMHDKKIPQNCCLFSESILPQGCVLEKILSIQKLYNVAFQEYCDLHKNLKRNHCKYNQWSYIDNFLHYLNEKGLTPQQVFEQVLGKDIQYLNDLNLARYLIATVANDCSFMIAVRKMRFEDNSNQFVLKTKKGCFLVNVGIFDLYPKPCSTIEKHIKRNREILDAYKFNK